MILGLILALGSALGGNVGFLLKQRGAVLARPIRLRHPARSAVDLFRSRWFLVGWIVSLLAWLLHVGALSLAALSSVQAVLSGGLVFLAVLAERFFGFRLERRQWAGVTITAAGLVVIGLTATPEDSQRSSLAALIAVEGAILLLGVGLVRISTRRGIEQRGEALLLATAAGVLFGVSDVAIKYLTHARGPLLGLGDLDNAEADDPHQKTGGPGIGPGPRISYRQLLWATGAIGVRLHHAAHVGHATAARTFLLGHLRDDRLRRENVLRDRRRVLERRARDHRGVDDARGDKVDDLVRGSVEPVALLRLAHVVDDDRALEAGVLGELAQ